MPTTNQNPEQHARDRIDRMLDDAGCVVQSKDQIHLNNLVPTGAGMKTQSVEGVA